MDMNEDLKQLIEAITPVDSPEPAGAAPKGELDDLFLSPAQETGVAPEPTYANDIAKTVDEMFRKGATTSEVNNFLRLQQIDATSMSAEALVKEGLRMEYPNMSVEELEELYNESYGELDAKTKAKLSKDAADVRKKIAELQATSREPASERDRRAQEQKMQMATKNWSQVTETMAERQFSDIRINLPSDKGEYTFAFPVSPDTKKALVEAGVQFAVQQGLPMNKESLPAIQDHMQRVAYYIEGPKMVEAALRDAISKGVRMGLRQQINPGQPREAAPPAADDTQWMGQRRMNPFG